MNVSRRRALSLVVFAALGLLSAACGGLNESEWRRELEPLLPDGATIVSSKTGNCTIEPNCVVKFVLDHHRSRYAEDVAAFEATMVAEGWTRIGGISRDTEARAQFTRNNVEVKLRLVNQAPWQGYVDSRGPDALECDSSLTIHQR